MIFYRLIVSIIFLFLLNGCVRQLQPQESVEVPKTKIIYQTSQTSDFLSCLAGSLKMTPEQRQREKKETQKIFAENPSSKNRLWLACLTLGEGSIRSIEYSLLLLQEQQELNSEPDSQLDGLIDIVGRLLASKKENVRLTKKLADQTEEINSLRTKLEKLKKIEKLMTEREKTAHE
jgi:hypothetical protein